MIYSDINDCVGNNYEVVYADPPWNYDYLVPGDGKQFEKKGSRQQFNKGFEPTKSAEDHYPTMSNEELYNMPIKEITGTNCLLFVWVTSPKLDIGMELIKAWGFDFKTVAFIWYKRIHNPGFYTMSECELVLVAKKGKIPTPRGARNVRQLISEKRTEHSRKPNEARWRIDEMFPTQKKIELFARKINKGWDQFGNQVDKYGEERDYFIDDLF